MFQRRVTGGVQNAAVAVVLAAVALLVAPIVLVTVVGWFLGQRLAVLAFRLWHGTRGRDMVIVYSNSPNWHAYVEREWMPRWGSRAVVLNWSERKRWGVWRPEVLVFRLHAGYTDFNPLVIVVPAWWRRVTTVPFFGAFRDATHGRPGGLRDAERQVDTALRR